MPLLLLALLGLATFLIVRTMRANGRRSASGGPVRVTEQLTDPREAAAILLVQQAAYEGRVSPAQKQIVLTMMTANFGVTGAEAEALYGFARMAVSQTGDARASLRRLLAPIKDCCTLAEMKDLLSMLEQVGETGGPTNDRQRGLIDDVARALSLPPPSAQITE